jgi:hypothetical protein
LGSVRGSAAKSFGFKRYDFPDIFGGDFCVSLQWQRDVFCERSVAPQGSVFEQDSESSTDLVLCFFGRFCKASAKVDDFALLDGLQSNEILHEGTFAGSASSHNRHNFSRSDGKGDVTHEGDGIVTHLKASDFNSRDLIARILCSELLALGDVTTAHNNLLWSESIQEKPAYSSCMQEQ